MAIELIIPSQIKKYLSIAFFPATGNEFTLYIANDTNRLYQWDGANYVEVSQQDSVNWGSIGGDLINQTDLQTVLNSKVDTEAGKGLSTNDYTTAEKNKLAGIQPGAEVNAVDSVNGYTGNVVLTKSDVGLSNVDNTSDANKPISTATQTALNAKQDTLVSGTNIKTINGNTILGSGDLTISTGLTVGTTPITSGTIGRVLFQGTGNVLQQSSSLFWDNTNSRLGIGTSTPSNTLHLSSSALNTRINIANSNATPNTGLSFLSGSTSSWSIAAYGANMNFTFYNDFLNADALFITRATNNIGINTTTDAGFKLDVNGTARVSGRITIGSDIIPSATGSSVALAAHAAASDIVNLSYYTGPLNATSGTKNIIASATTFNPSSGAAAFNQLNFAPTINQTGTANGITRGLYINPTLTAAADFRAIETTAGKVIFNGDNTPNVQAGYNLMLKGSNPRLRIEGGVAGTSLADSVIQFADSAGDNWIIKSNRSNSNLVFGIGWNNSIANVVTFGSTSIQPALGITGVSASIGTALSVQNSSLTSLLTVLNNGNVLINTTTDAGFRLDVNGTARVQGQTTLRGAGTTSSTTALLVTNNTPTDLFKITDDGAVTSSGNITFTNDFRSIGTSGQTLRFSNTGSETRMGVSGIGTSGRFFIWSAGSNLIRNLTHSNGQSFINTTSSDITVNASAAFQIESTTLGFLPPRMTTTQKNAISAPATGLQVFDTTLNQMSYYNGTTWINL